MINEYSSFFQHESQFSTHIPDLASDICTSVVLPISGHDLVNGCFIKSLIDLGRQDHSGRIEIIYVVNNSHEDKWSRTERYRYNLQLLKVLNILQSGDFEKLEGLFTFSENEYAKLLSAMSRIVIGYVDLANEPFEGRTSDDFIERSRKIGEQIILRRYLAQNRDGTYLLLDTDSRIDRSAISNIKAALKNNYLVRLPLDTFPAEGGVGIWDSHAYKRFDEAVRNLVIIMEKRKHHGFYAIRVCDIPYADDTRYASPSSRDTFGSDRDEVVALGNVVQTAFRGRSQHVGGIFGRGNFKNVADRQRLDLCDTTFAVPNVIGNMHLNPPQYLNHIKQFLLNKLSKTEFRKLEQSIKNRIRKERLIHSIRKSKGLEVLKATFELGQSPQLTQYDPEIERWMNLNTWIIDEVADFDKFDDLLMFVESCFPEVFGKWEETYYEKRTAEILGIIDFFNDATLDKTYKSSRRAIGLGKRRLFGLVEM